MNIEQRYARRMQYKMAKRRNTIITIAVILIALYALAGCGGKCVSTVCG